MSESSRHIKGSVSPLLDFTLHINIVEATIICSLGYVAS